MTTRPAHEADDRGVRRNGRLFGRASGSDPPCSTSGDPPAAAPRGSRGSSGAHSPDRVHHGSGQNRDDVLTDFFGTVAIRRGVPPRITVRSPRRSAHTTAAESRRLGTVVADHTPKTMEQRRAVLDSSSHCLNSVSGGPWWYVNCACGRKRLAVLRDDADRYRHPWLRAAVAARDRLLPDDSAEARLWADWSDSLWSGSMRRRAHASSWEL